MNYQDGYVDVDGSSLYYEEIGTGRPVVLLRGFSLDRRMWDAQWAFLRSQYRVVRYDLRGFGKSAPSTKPYTHADDLFVLIDHLGLERVDLIGLSLGGGAAINAAILYPERVRALVVVDPSLGGFRWSSEFTAAQTAIRATAKEAGVQAARAHWLSLPIFRAAMSNPPLAEQLVSIVDDYAGWHWLHADPGRPFTPPAIDRLQEIGASTLVIVGTLDTADFHGIASTLESHISRAQKLVLPDVGHMANLEASAQFNEIIEAFLADVDAPPNAQPFVSVGGI
jgi:3-oxoadipate enol-lactonase